jgi:predicted nucleotidyltransferase
MPAGLAGIMGVVGSRSDLLRLHRDAILDLLATRGINEVRIFGSVARGKDDSASDIDLIVELQGERSSGAELLEVLELSELLTGLVGARVDVVTARSLRPEVRALALAEAVPL